MGLGRNLLAILDQPDTIDRIAGPSIPKTSIKCGDLDALVHEVPCQPCELSWEILMDESDPHQKMPRKRFRRFFFSATS